jgi:hypothetical protein
MLVLAPVAEKMPGMSDNSEEEDFTSAATVPPFWTLLMVIVIGVVEPGTVIGGNPLESLSAIGI